MYDRLQCGSTGHSLCKCSVCPVWWPSQTSVHCMQWHVLSMVWSTRYDRTGGMLSSSVRCALCDGHRERRIDPSYDISLAIPPSRRQQSGPFRECGCMLFLCKASYDIFPAMPPWGWQHKGWYAAYDSLRFLSGVLIPWSSTSHEIIKTAAWWLIVYARDCLLLIYSFLRLSSCDAYTGNIAATL